MSITNPYDHALKLLVRTYPDEFLRLGFPGQSVRLLGTQANVELALEIDRVDFLHEMELDGERAYFHIDFQLEHEESCRRRFFVYNAMLTELQKPVPVVTLPVYLRPRQKALPKFYEVKVGKTLFHRFTYEPLQLWDYVERIRSGELYIFAPLLPLLVQPMDAALLVAERQLILTYETDPARQRTLLTTAILVAAQAKLFDSDFLWALFKEDTMDFDNPVIAKLFDKYYGEKLAEEKRQLAEEKRQLEAKMAHDLAVATQQVTEAAQREVQAAQREAQLEAALRREAEAEAEAEAARRRQAEAETAQREAEATHQWQELMLKVLEHRFQVAPVALVSLLYAVSPAQRNQARDLILDAPDTEQCLQGLRQLLVSKQP